MNTAYQVYLLHSKPQDSKVNNLIEIVSEYLLHCAFFGFIFGELTSNPIYDYHMGWFTVSSICFLVALNILNMVVDAVQKAYKAIRFKFHDIKRKKDQERKKKMREDELYIFKEHLDMLDRFGPFEISERRIKRLLRKE